MSLMPRMPVVASVQEPPEPLHAKIVDISVTDAQSKQMVPLDLMWGEDVDNIILHGQLVDKNERWLRPVSLPCADLETISFDFGFTSSRPPGVWLTIATEEFRVVGSSVAYTALYSKWQEKDRLMMEVGRLLFAKPDLSLRGIVKELAVTPTELMGVSSLLKRVLPMAHLKVHSHLHVARCTSACCSVYRPCAPAPPQLCAPAALRPRSSAPLYPCAPEPLSAHIHLPGCRCTRTK